MRDVVVVRLMVPGWLVGWLARCSDMIFFGLPPQFTDL